MVAQGSWICGECGKENGKARETCWSCGTPKGYSIPSEELSTTPVTLTPLQEREKNMIVTTAPSLDGYRISETLDIVSAECVFGMNIFRDFFASITDVFGGRSEATQKVLRDTRKVCLNELRKEAAMMGADAVIAVKLDYSEFSGQGKSMLFLAASGTAVKVNKIQ